MSVKHTHNILTTPEISLLCSLYTRAQVDKFYCILQQHSGIKNTEKVLPNVFRDLFCPNFPKSRLISKGTSTQIRMSSSKDCALFLILSHVSFLQQYFVDQIPQQLIFTEKTHQIQMCFLPLRQLESREVQD